MHPTDADSLNRYVKQLSRSERGRNALRRLLEWLDDDGIGLDYANQTAVLNVIALAWRYPGGTRDAMREIVER